MILTQNGIVFNNSDENCAANVNNLLNTPDSLYLSPPLYTDFRLF